MSRRISNSKGQSVPVWVWRTAAIAALPIILPCAFLSTLIAEFRHAFKFAWLDTRAEWEAFQANWNGDEAP